MTDRFRDIKRILIVVLFFNWLVAFAKLLYGLVTRSASMTADGAHSFGDGASNIIGLVGIMAASKPVDEDHPYGHKKYETIATLGIAATLFFAAFHVIRDAFDRLFNPISPDVTVFSFAIMAVTMFVNIMVMRYEHRKGMDLSSDILVCDSMHTKTDVFATIAVIASLVAVKFGFVMLDALVAGVISVIIARAAFRILKQSFDVLSDAVAVDTSQIASVVKGIEGVKSIHKIRTRGRKDDVHVDLHVAVDSKMRVDAAHHLSHTIDAVLKEKIQGVTDVIVHVEPFKKLS
ncbi:MAG: cation diffusion facilitator family transporter [Candidatus Omnitrophota bacterium]